MDSIPQQSQLDPQSDPSVAFMDARRLPDEVQAEIRESDAALWRALVLWLIEGQRQGVVPDDAGFATAEIKVELPTIATNSGDPLTLTINPVIVYKSADPSDLQIIPLLGPNAALNRALGLKRNDSRIRAMTIFEPVVSPYQWLTQLNASPPEFRRYMYPLSPEQVRNQFAEIGREPPEGRTIANYADAKLIPFARDEALSSDGRGHRRYPSDTVARIQAIANLRDLCKLRLSDIARRIDRSNWYHAEDRLVND
jgi:hypothetical protein